MVLLCLRNTELRDDDQECSVSVQSRDSMCVDGPTGPAPQGWPCHTRLYGYDILGHGASYQEDHN